MVREGRSWSGRERNCCFLNTRDQRFATISTVSGFDLPDDARAVAITDWDLDGRPDMWMTSRTSPRVRFFHNRSKSGAHFVAFKLRGVQCNRDAIGARLELFLGRAGTTKRIKTLRAGEGFLAQSSKWVQFGLGDETQIDRLVVRWPGGRAEQFTGLLSNSRYGVEQGTGRAVAWASGGRKVELTPSKVDAPKTSERARIVALSKPLLPALTYRDFDGRSLALSSGDRNADGDHSKATLVNLWASWCAPCLEELQAFTQNEDRLRSAGIHVVALCVDEVTESGTADLSRARQILDELDFPFRSGVADRRVVQNLDTLHRSLVDLQHDLPVPSSFLLDCDNQLVVLYKGPVSTQQLLDDLRLLDVSPAQLRDAAVPYSGTWITKPLQPYPQEIALKFVERGETDEAVRYLRSYLEFVDNASDNATAVADLADIHFLLGRLLVDRGDIADGLSIYREAIRINPQYRKARVNLAELLLRQNRPAQAITHFAEALQVEPDDASTLVAKGVAHVRLRQVEQAIACYRAALRLEPAQPEARANLARLLHAQEKLAEAALLYRAILSDQPASGSDANNLAWILATSPDPAVYNSAEAVEWARKACEATQHSDPRYLTTLAAAYSEQGQFKEAIITAKTAIRGAYAIGQPKVAAAVEKHLRYYEARKSYREGRSVNGNTRRTNRAANVDD